MSEEWEENWDESELDDLYTVGEDNMDPEDVFTMVMINRKRKVKTTVELQDKDGDVVPLKDVLQQLIQYSRTKMEDTEGNQFNDQIMPLMSQAVVGSLGRMIGIRNTAFHLSNETTRIAFIQTMCIGLLLLKFIQKEELKIYTYEESVSDEEIEEIDRRSKANSLATLASLAGANPQEILQHLRNEGHITDEDLEQVLSGDRDEDDDSENKSGKGKN